MKWNKYIQTPVSNKYRPHKDDLIEKFKKYYDRLSTWIKDRVEL